MKYLLEALPGGKAPWSVKETVPEVKSSFTVPVPVAKLAGASGVRLSLIYYECGEGSEAICRIKSHIWELPLKFEATATERVIALSSSPGQKDEKKDSP